MNVPPQLIRYGLLVEVPVPDGMEWLTFRVQAPRCPRIGELLNFDGQPTLRMIVTEVEHWYFTSDEGSPPYDLTVVAEVQPSTVADARSLLHGSEALRRWIGQFPMLEPDPPVT